MPLMRSNSAPQAASSVFFQRSETDPMIQQMEEQPLPTSSSKDTMNNNNVNEKKKPSDILTSTVIPMPDSSTSLTATDSGIINDNSDHHNNDNTSNKCCYRTTRCGQNIVDDVNRTIKQHWKEEMTNFNLQTIAVGFFLFFACIAPAITFGAIYAKATNNWIGAVEMIAATSWCGIVYALIGGQPMMINGGTGPVLAFTEILFKMSDTIGVPFLTFNAWIGLWVCVYMVIAALVDLNRILKYATNFTDEIFSFLISTIFIINAIGSPFAPIGVVYYFFPDHPSHQAHADDPSYNYLTVALFSLIIFVGTVQVSFLLRKIKFSPFLYTQLARNVVTDFAVVTSIVIWTVVASVSGIQTETLNVPETFAPTYACCDATCDTNWPTDCPDLAEPYQYRPWLVDLGDLNGKAWIPFMAAGPAALAFVLVFLDDGITWHLINAPVHKLKHGSAYSYDTILIGIMIAINSMLGFPWLVAATVRSLNHVHAMAEKTPDGRIVSVRETRLTGLFIHLLCLASIFALNVLKLIPVPVLYGVFLFMGLVSLSSNTFWNRITMFFMQPSKYPIEPYTVHMRPRRMHYYTLIQLALFALLYVVKAIKAIAIAFPLIIACCIPIRMYLLPRIFTQEELVMVDGDEDAVKTWLYEHPEEMTESEHKDLSEEEPMKVTDEEAAAVTMGAPPVHEAEEEKPPTLEEDQAMPLPDIAAAMARSKRRATRRKMVSCPPHMLFAEVPVSATSIEISAVVAEEHEEEEEEEVKEEEGMGITPTAEEEPSSAVRRRRHKTRTKSVSCPPHMLFQEASRQVASNYFFG